MMNNLLLLDVPILKLKIFFFFHQPTKNKLPSPNTNLEHEYQALIIKLKTNYIWMQNFGHATLAK